MKILLTGKNGQVGSALERALAPVGELMAFDRSGLDLRDPKSIEAGIRNAKPAVIVNAAAYTGVDRAETERETAFAVNATAVGILAQEAGKLGALLIHFSTDYVFDGEKAGAYTEEDAPNPINLYGASKLAGERAVAASGCRHLVFRTSWVYAAEGRNFLRAILEASQTKPELRVVDDQHGAPTSANAIALAIVRILKEENLREKASGLYHLSAAGETTWYGFAKELLSRRGLDVPVVPVSSAEYATPAKRPKMSLLDNSKFVHTFGFSLPHWREQLAAVLPLIH
ncbi:MAG: dTDP-4-dehydrorhamnose reductase [Pseudomonadota bacterium]